MIFMDAMNCWLVINTPRTMITDVVPFIVCYFSYKHESSFHDHKIKANVPAILQGHSLKPIFHIFILVFFLMALIFHFFTDGKYHYFWILLMKNSIHACKSKQQLTRWVATWFMTWLKSFWNIYSMHACGTAHSW